LPASHSTRPGLRLQKRLGLREARDLNRTDAPFVERDAFYFLHVPKSGGTSFDAFLSGFFTAEEHAPPELQIERPDLWSLHDQSAHRYRHGAFWLNDVLPQRPNAHFVTFLRDPIKRVISHYWHLRLMDDITDGASQWVEHRRQVRDHARRCSLAEWAATQPGEPCAYVRNLFVRMLGGERYVAGRSRDQSEEWLERAKSNLRDVFVYFGLLEDYLRSKRVFCQTFGLPLHYAAGEERCNTSPSADARARPDESTLELLRRENSLDVQLYAYAQELFADRAARLDRLSGDPLYSPARRWWPFTGDGGYALTASELRGAGLHEVDGESTPQELCWTGRLPVTTLDLAMQLPRRGTVEVRVHTVANVDPLEAVRMRLDGLEAESTVVEYRVGHQEIVSRFQLIPELRHRQVHALEIAGPVRVPVDAAGRPCDSRALGIAISRIDVAWERRTLSRQLKTYLDRKAA
jgi:hypothetical protein